MRFFTSGGAALALLGALGAGSAVLGFAATQRIMPGHLTAVETVQHIFIPTPQQLFGVDHLRVLVVGLDYDYNDRDEETSAHSRSDIIMAVNLDFVDHRIYELSVPRDMVATLPDGRIAKINEAQSDGGVRESEHVVSEWLGIPSFDRYVVLRIDTMKDLINALGGVTVDVENSDALRESGPNGPIDYDDSWGHLHVHLKPGVQHLDGDQAVGYARFRHDWCSDPCRIMRQQQVIHAIADQIDKHQLTTLMHVQSLLEVMRKDVDTNLKANEELSLAVAFEHLVPKDIVAAQVPYVRSVYLPDYGDSIVPDETAKAELVAAMLGEPPPPEPSDDELATLPAGSIRVAVENGTNVAGLATKVAHRLAGAGFVVTSIGNADVSDVERSTIAGGSPSMPSPFKVRRALGTAAQDARVSYASDAASAGNSVVLVIGADLAKAWATPQPQEASRADGP